MRSHARVVFSSSTSSPKKGQSRQLPFVAIHLKDTNIEIVRSLPQPFDHSTIMNALGVTRISAGNVVYQWRKMGWIESEEWGKYKRTKSFGLKL